MDKREIFVIEEVELTSYLLGEISNKKSNDYLNNYYFTHRCVDSSGVVWYKAHTDYTVEHTTSLWFKEAEVSWFEE